MEQKKHLVNRREFLSSSLTYVASTGLMAAAPVAALGQDKTDTSTTKTSGEIIYRTLGRTGIKMPIVGMGVMNANNPDIVHAAYEAGIRHFDTAARYQYGRNEQMVGEVIKRLGVRDNVIIGTKEMRPAQRSEMSEEASRAKLIELCEGSLRRLKSDYVDILYLHSVAPGDNFHDDGLMKGIEELKKQGKIRAAGVSTHEGMADVINAITEVGFFDVILTAFNVAMAGNPELLNAIANAASKKIAIVAMKTQAGGSRMPNPDSLNNYSSTTVATASLKWVLRNENITAAIPGFDNYQHMKEDFSVVGNIEYTPEEAEFLSDNSITLGFGFCHQCRQCVARCPHNVDVPALMRTHMYAAQYGNFYEARSTLKDISPRRGLANCGNCTECPIRCANSVNIKRKIKELKLIFA